MPERDRQIEKERGREEGRKSEFGFLMPLLHCSLRNIPKPTTCNASISRSVYAKRGQGTTRGWRIVTQNDLAELRDTA